MARMIPGMIGENSAPQGEIDVFECLLSDTPKNWVALYSVRLKSHEFKKSGEADFVLITDKGVLVIEVKGGVNKRNSKGQWVQSKNGSPDRVSNEGPFKQSMGAYFAIEKYLKEAGHSYLIERLPWGWGVIMPHCFLDFPDNDPEIDSEMLLDQRGFPEEITCWANQLTDYWRKDHNRKKIHKLRRGFKLQDRVPPSTRDKIVGCLRPRFQSYNGLGQATRQAEQNLVKLTEKQCQYLLIARSNPRTLLEGAAGTGKTLLAFEFAKECSEKGEKVLFVCYNVNLARLLRNRAANDPAMFNVTINNYHQVVKHIRRDAGLSTVFSHDWGIFNSNCFDLVAESIEIVGESALFDRVIIDEGQDLMGTSFLDVLDLLLKGGLVPPPSNPRGGGKWLVALDKDQALYTDNFEQKAVDRLEHCMPARLKLIENCRNTRPVALHVYGFSQVGSCQVMTAAGPQPVIDYFSSEKSLIKLLRTYINDTLCEYEKIGNSPNDIVLLTTRKELIPDALLESQALKHPLARYREANENNVIWETIHGFKGLEASTVILLGVEDLNSNVSRQLMYVGGSRARTRLIWLLPEEFSESVQVGLLKIQSLNA